MENARLPCYDSPRRDRCSEATDSLRLSDVARRREHNWCNTACGLMDNLVIKHLRAGAAATVIVPYWPDRSGYHGLSERDRSGVFPPSLDLFSPGRLGVRIGVGPPKWPADALQLPLRARCPAPAF
eukprot:jgi/Tetstr1/444459/TSEL_032342.t1